jgi:hypothetical protein
MAGNILIDESGAKGWDASNGMFRVVLGTAFACFLDEARAPTFALYCRRAFGPDLHETWPDRYPDEPQLTYYVFSMHRDIPHAEHAAIIEALEKLADAFEHDTIDSRVSWNRESNFAERTRELIALMREELAPPAPK